MYMRRATEAPGRRCRLESFTQMKYKAYQNLESL